MRRETTKISLYVTNEEKQHLERAANRASLPVSTWLRVLGLREADATETREKEKGKLDKDAKS